MPFGIKLKNPGTSAVFEILTMVALVPAAGVLWWPDDPFLLNANPHPFWIIVLLSAIRYGTPAGPGVGALCSAIHMSALVAHGFDFRAAMHLGDPALLVPVLYVVVGIFVGSRVDAYGGKESHLRKTNQGLKADLDSLQSRHMQLSNSYRELEGRIAGESDTFAAFYESAKGLDAESSVDTLRVLCDMIINQIGATSLSVWRRDGGGPWKPIFSDSETQGLPMLAIDAYRKGRVLSVADFADGTYDSEPCLAAGPVAMENSNKSYVVVINAMPFVKFTRHTIRIFGIALNWASRALERQTLVSLVKKRDIFDTSMGLTSELFFRTSVRKQMLLMRRNKQTSCLLFFVIPADIKGEKRRRCRIFIATILRDILRMSDTPAWFDDDDIFAVHLPLLKYSEGEIVINKIVSAIDSFDLKPYGDESSLVLGHYLVETGYDDDFDEVLDKSIKAALEVGR